MCRSSLVWPTLIISLIYRSSYSYASGVTIDRSNDCRSHNHLRVCTSRNSTLLSVTFEDANAVQTIDDVELHLENCGIIDITGNSFNEARNATALFLSGNKLSRISKRRFNPLDQLTYLDLKSNRISTIEDGAFARLANLETLLLDGNCLVKLSPGIWKGLGSSLRELYATNNTIVPRRNMFRSLGQLETLALDSNDIDALPIGTFNGLVNLDLLYLSRNNIVDVHNELFRGLDRLNELDLGKNLIRHVTPGIFRDLRSLESLWLNENRIAALVQPATFDGLKRLAVLFIGNNEPLTLDFIAFRGLGNTSVEPGFLVDGIFKGYRQGESPKPHPCYRSTSMDYGWYSPTVHTVPTVYYARSTDFSDELARAGMYRNRSLNTELDKTLF